MSVALFFIGWLAGVTFGWQWRDNKAMTEQFARDQARDDAWDLAHGITPDNAQEG